MPVAHVSSTHDFAMKKASLVFLVFILAVLGCPGAYAAVEVDPERTSGYYRFPAIHQDVIVFTAEGDLWRVGIRGGVAQRLTSHPGMESHAAISPDGRTLAFSAEYEGPTEVYTMPLEGGPPTRRTYEGERHSLWVGRRMARCCTPPGIFRPCPTATCDRGPELRRAHLLPLSQASDGTSIRREGVYFTPPSLPGSSTKRYQGGTAQNLGSLKWEAMRLNR